MSYTFLDFIGNVGVFLIILGYFLLQINRIKSNDFLYSFVNMIGAILIIISLIEDFNLSAFIIEIFWVGISLIGIFKFVFYKSTQKNV